MDADEERDRPAETEAQRQRTSALDELRVQLERSGERLQRGRRLNLPGDTALPARSLVAVAIFVAVFVIVYLLCWAAMGTAGLAIGLLTGLAAGTFAVKLFADRGGG